MQRHIARYTLEIELYLDALRVVSFGCTQNTARFYVAVHYRNAQLRIPEIGRK